MIGTRLSAADALRVKFALAEPALQAAAAQLWALPGLKRRYGAYLRVMHGVLRASVPLMVLAARRCAELGPRDAAAAPLRAYLEAHIARERGHDDWLLADLAALGFDPAEPLAVLPPPSVARLVGAQYYWVEHHHPVALLGYIAVMEGNAPPAQLVDRLVLGAGVPEAAVRTVREHAVLDADHASMVFDLLDGLPLTAAQTNAVAVSGLHTADALITLFAHVVRISGGPP